MTTSSNVTYQVVYNDRDDKWRIAIVPTYDKNGLAVPGFVTETQAAHRCNELNALRTAAP
jgi:hypothetical protein